MSVGIGILVGNYFVPEYLLEYTDTLLIVGLSIMLLIVGIELGMEGTVVSNFKKIGVRVIAFPIASIVGTLAGVAVTSIFLPISLKDSFLVGSGFGWYTLAPAMISSYSEYVSAISFMHNVGREVIGLILIPIIAKRIGFIEAAAGPGAGSMDLALPVIEKGTSPNITVYAFVIGVVLSAVVPFAVQFFMMI